MPITSSNWGELVVPGISRAFYIGFGRRASMVDQLYNVQSSTRANEIHLGLGNIGSDGWADFEKTGKVNYADFARGYKQTLTHVEFAKGMTVQRKLVEDDQFNVIDQRARAIGDSAFRFRESAAAALFNNAFTASGTDAYGFTIVGSDAVALASASHPRNPDSAATTDSNTSNVTLTAANISTVRKNMLAFVDDTGDKLNVTPDTILIPPDLEDTALVHIRSTQDPVSANNAINPQSTGRWNLKVWHYLSSASNWFMIDSGRMSQALYWYDRVPLELTASRTDPDTYEMSVSAYMRFTRGATDWRWFYGAGA